MLDKLKQTPGRVEVIGLIDAHLAEHPDCACVKALQLAARQDNHRCGVLG